MTDSTAVAVPAKGYLATLKGQLQSAAPALQRLLGEKEVAERFAQVVFNTVSRTPFLQKCTPLSIVRACIQAAETTLEIGGWLGEAALVPYRNGNTGLYEAMFQPMYRGKARLAIEQDVAVSIDPVIVHANDTYEWDDSVLPPRFKHKPVMLGKDPGEPVACYVVITLPNGFKKVEVMSRQEIEGIRDRYSQSWKRDKETSPWFTSPEEMWKKTVFNRQAKLLGIKPGTKLAKALAADEAAEAGDMEATTIADEQPAEIVAGTAEEVPPERPTNLADATKKLRGRKQSPAVDPGEERRLFPAQDVPRGEDPFLEEGKAQGESHSAFSALDDLLGAAKDEKTLSSFAFKHRELIAKLKPGELDTFKTALRGKYDEVVRGKAAGQTKEPEKPHPPCEACGQWPHKNRGCPNWIPGEPTA